MVRLVERRDLGRFERFHMDGHWDADGTRMVEDVTGPDRDDNYAGK